MFFGVFSVLVLVLFSNDSTAQYAKLILNFRLSKQIHCDREKNYISFAFVLILYIVYRFMYVYCNYLCVISNKLCLNLTKLANKQKNMYNKNCIEIVIFKFIDLTSYEVNKMLLFFF